MLSDETLKELTITLNLVDEKLLVLQLDGFLDLYNSDLFVQYIDKILKDWEFNIALDCTNLKHVNSTGFLALVRVENKLKEVGKHLYIVNLSEKISEKFELVGFSKILRQAKNVIEVMNELN